MRVIPIILTLALAGCGTTYSIAKGSFGPFSGVRADFRLFEDEPSWIADVPLSFLVDFAVLPISCWAWFVRGGR